MSTPSQSDADSAERSPIEAFTGSFAPTPTGPLYHAGLAVVAFAMVLLPLIYVGLIGLATWGVVWHLTHNLWLFDGASGRGGFGRLLIYLGPAVAGGILVFFMVKPFFAARREEPEVLSLDPADEPLLFAFVERICRLVGAPVPGRIDVDCQVNASASLKRGFLSRDLVLTIGLPLASGLPMREFAGVLAHEFGHFAQGAGMRLTYLIRRINHWFARVVFERDAWDVKLEEAAKETDLRIGIVLHAARGCVWLTRRILWALMHAGQAISCFMMRQMEFDADSYEAKLAGSDAFESTARRLRLLSVATQFAYDDVRQSWTSSRLPENLPLLIDHKASTLPPEVHQKLAEANAASRTGWFDTHPCDDDRVKAVRALNEPGVFRLTSPATQLFSDFMALSKRVTRHQYEKHFNLEFTDQNLMPAEEMIRESSASAEADAMVRKFYGVVNLSLERLFPAAELPGADDEDGLGRSWNEARAATEELRPAAVLESNSAGELYRRRAQLNAAHRLTRAGFRLEAGEFGLPPDATSAGEQERAARIALDQIEHDAAAHVSRLKPFLAALNRRVALALNWAQRQPGRVGSEDAGRIAEYVRLASAVGMVMPLAHRLAAQLQAFTLLAQNMGNHSNPAEVEEHLRELAGQLRTVNEEIQQRIGALPYPFPHARGSMTMAEYLRSDRPAENEWHRAFLDSDAHVDHLFALNYRLIGKVLSIADAAENDLERRTAVAGNSQASR